MENFKPLPSLIGGLMIGIAATLLLWTTGRIAGISGILGGFLSRDVSNFNWRLAFIVGLLFGSCESSLKAAARSLTCARQIRSS